MWFKKKKKEQPTSETNGHITHNLYKPGANPQPKNPKKKIIPETIEIYMDFQVWGI